MGQGRDAKRFIDKNGHRRNPPGEISTAPLLAPGTLCPGQDEVQSAPPTAAPAVRRLRADLPVVIMTGHAELPSQQGAGGGTDGLLLKPFRGAQLTSMLRQVLDRRASATGGPATPESE